MTGSVLKVSKIKELEQKLDRQKEVHQRMLTIDELASLYIFTDVRKAQVLLAEQLVILDKYPNPDYKLNYLLHTATIENQLYNYVLAEMHFLEAIEILQERGDVKQQVETYIDYAGTCINLIKMDVATTYLDKAARLLDVFPDPILQARITCREGFLNLHYSLYSKAIELLLEAEKDINAAASTLSLKDYYFLTLIHSGLGKVYERNEDIEKSVKSFQMVLSICKEIGMRTRMSWHYLNVGNGFLALEDIKKAEEYYIKAIGFTDDISQQARAGAYANLGYCCILKEEYKKALSYFNRAEQIYKKSDKEYFNFCNIESWRALVYAETGKYKKAKEHYGNAYKFAKSKNDYKQLASVFKAIAAFFAKNGEFENAYRYQLLQDEMSERYQEEVNRRTVLELEVKYEAEKKKQEAEMLRLQTTGLQLKALRAQMNPHFMYNALNSIQHYITSNEVKSAAKYLSRFATLMRQSLDYSELETISLEKELEFLKNYLEINQKLRFENELEYLITVDDEIEEDIMAIPTMLIQPYIENAIEHGLRRKKNGFLKLEFNLIDDYTLECIVEDNGIGRYRSAELQKEAQKHLNHKPMGTAITQERLEILNKSNQRGSSVRIIDLESDKGEVLGTRVEIKVPVTIIQKKQEIT